MNAAIFLVLLVSIYNADGRYFGFVDSEVDTAMIPRPPFGIEKASHHVKSSTPEQVMQCLTVNKTHGPLISDCRASDERPMGPKPLELGCFASFNAEGIHIRSGCYVHQDVAFEECHVPTCVAEEGGSGPFFCCCQGDMCNQNVALVPVDDEE